MSRRKRIILFWFLAGVVAVLGYWGAGSNEPEYGGKALGYWVDHTWSSSDPDPHGEALKAIRSMGTNAVPDLIHMLGGPKSAFSKWYEKQIVRLPGRLPEKLYFLHSRDQRAAVALGMIGPEAAPAAPALAAKLGDFPQGVAVTHPYAEALVQIGAAAAGPLGKALHSADPQVRKVAMETLGALGSEAREAVPELMRVVEQSDNAGERRAVFTLLQRFKSDPEVLIPFLVRCLDHESAEVRLIAVEMLGLYGGRAKGAVPKLSERAGKDVPEVAKAAGEALKRIEAGGR